MHLSGELFKNMAGVDMIHVPYKGSAPAITDLLGGQVHLMFDNIANFVASRCAAGKLRALAVTGPSALRVLPDLPTLAESGFPGFNDHLLVRAVRAGRHAATRSSTRC